MPAKRSASDLADEFLALWERFCPELPKPEAEYKFDPGRRWRFDWAWPEQKVAVEVDGGQYVANGGRHNRDSDRWKMNEAATYGWRVLRFSPQMLAEEPLRCCWQTARALGCDPPRIDGCQLTLA